MKFKRDISIEKNIIKYTLTSEYNEQLTTEEEKEIETLNDYIRKLKISDIDFSGDVDVSTGMPIVAKSSSGTTEKVTVNNVLPKVYVVDDRLNIEFSIDVSRIYDSEITEKLTTKVLVGQAKVAVFADKIEKKIKEILDQMRKEDNAFEGVDEIVL